MSNLLWFKVFPFRIKRYLEYYFSALTIYDLHSPKLYRLIDFVMDNERQYIEMARLRVVRDQLSRVPNPYEPPMAATPGNRKRITTRRSRLHAACCSKFSAECMFRIAVFFQPKVILHLGAGNGLDSLYLKKAAGSSSKLKYEEKAIERKLIAEKLFAHFSPSVEVLNDSSEIEVAGYPLDMLVLGSNFIPRENPPGLLERLLQNTNPEGAWMITGIHKDPEKFKLWEKLKKNKHVTTSIRCWSFGVLFFSKDFHEKLDLTIIPWLMKPWRIGLWGTGYRRSDNIMVSE